MTATPPHDILANPESAGRPPVSEPEPDTKDDMLPAFWVRNRPYMRTINELIGAVRREAARAEFPVDIPVYDKSGKDPAEPILYAGSLQAPICVFGRDLGKDEVTAGQPLIGAGGRLVRAVFYEAEHGKPRSESDRRVESILPGIC